MIGNLRLVLDVEVFPGNEQSSKHSMPGLIALLSNLGHESRPRFVRGDCDWGNDSVMTKLEELGVDYLFKVKKHKGAPPFFCAM